MQLKFCVVGAGFSGAVIARSLAEAGHSVLVVDERAHIGGNCHTERDSRTNVMKHQYGPHIFHTDNMEVVSFLKEFGEFVDYRHRVVAQSGGSMFSMPINLLTINQFFGTTFSPSEAKDFLNTKRRHEITAPANFEEQALSMVGEEIYHAFFRGYTRKQWGMEPTNLPASILKRLPMRFNYDDSYFSHRYQAIPRGGYTGIIEAILDTPRVEIRLACTFESLEDRFDHIIYSGPIDRYFSFDSGRLGYRTLDFETFYADGDAQGTAIVNYCDEDIPYTRITEHKHFSPWDAASTEGSVLYREFSRYCGPDDIPYYPIRLTAEQTMLRQYVERAKITQGVTFVGRLGTYRYIDMDVTIAEAMKTAAAIKDSIERGVPIPSFVVNPLD
jgi:UDP-galactopyranose mutase